MQVKKYKIPLEIAKAEICSWLDFSPNGKRGSTFHGEIDKLVK